MSITTHETTIRQYVKNHTKDDIACFFEDQFVKKEAGIKRLRARNALLEGVAREFMDMFIPAIDKTGRWIDFCDPCSSQCEDMPNLTAYMKEVSG